MKIYRLSGITLATLMTLYGATNTMANHSVEVRGHSPEEVRNSYKGKAGQPSRYRGDRITAGLAARQDRDIYRPDSYEVRVINAQGEIKNKLDRDGFGGTLERNVPFDTKNGKIVGLYVPESAYKADDQSARYPADLVPAQNVTHVFYSFLGICDYGQDRPAGKLPVTHNRRVQDANDQTWLKQMCADKGDFNVTKAEPIRSHHLLGAMARMKLANANVKAMVSIGGNTLSSPFHGMVETEEGRKIFVQSVVQLIKEHPMIDGIDLAWEFVGGNALGGNTIIGLNMMESVNGERQAHGYAPDGYEAEKKRYTLLVKALRKALDENFGGGGKLLSATVSADPGKLAAIDFDALKDDFSFVNVMTYGFSGAWIRYPTHQVGVSTKPLTNINLFLAYQDAEDEAEKQIEVDGRDRKYIYLLSHTSAEGAIKTILNNNRSFPSEKLVIGAAAHSRGWHTIRVKPAHDKFFWHGLAAGERGELGVAGTFKNGSSDFREVYDKYMTGDAAHLYYDKQAQAAYTWVPKPMEDGYNVAQVESFDDPRSILEKGKLVKQYNLGGLFSPDASADNGLLINALNAALCHKKTDGQYYTFSQKYAGEVDTVELKGINWEHRVRETLSGPTTFTFDHAAAQALCEVK